MPSIDCALSHINCNFDPQVFAEGNSRKGISFVRRQWPQIKPQFEGMPNKGELFQTAISLAELES